MRFEKTMIKLIDGLDFLVFRFWLIFSFVIISGAFFIKALYSMEDYPYFVWNKAIDVAFVVLSFSIFYIIFKNKDYIQEKISFVVLWVLFGGVALAFVLLVPLVPFSDMHYVSEGALLISKLDIDAIKASDYLQLVIKNLKVSMFYGLIALVLPSNILSFKIINIFLYLMSSHFISLISRELGFKYNKITFIVCASFIPLISYCNHIYFDLPTFCLCSAALYFFIKGGNKNMIFSAFFVGTACGLRVLAIIFLIAICVGYVFDNINKGTLKRSKILIVILFIIISLAIPKGLSVVVDGNFRRDDAQEESIWTLFYMGINDEEFGFMHNEILEEGQKDFGDFITLLTSRSIGQNTKLFTKKIFWEWSQGTYQSQRYAFGYDTENALDKYQYETVVTKYVLKDGQLIRQLYNSLCRAQYFVLFILMCVGTISIIQNREMINRFRVMYYLFFGTFLVLIFYELKSRYVFHCIIPMVTIAMEGMEYLFKNHEFVKCGEKRS